MKFDYPAVLIAFAVFIPVIIFDLYGKFKKHQKTLPDILKNKLRFSSFSFRLFTACAIIALAGPRWGTEFVVSGSRRALDIVFAVDLSRSMDITDAKSGDTKSRLERGLDIAYNAGTAVPGARFGAVIGRSRAYLAVPLTWDNDAVFNFLETIDGSSMTGRSTNLEALLDTAAESFQPSFQTKKVIVLISDGESLQGAVKNAVERCAKNGIIIDAVASGSDEGRPVPPDSGLTEDYSGVISRRDAAVMRNAAERTGGIYINADRGDAVSVLTSHLLSFTLETGPGSGKTEQKERRTFFIILAVIFYCLSKIIPLSPYRKHGKVLILLLFLTPLVQNCSKEKLYLLEANYMLSRGDYDKAQFSYIKALNSGSTAPYAQYGLGLNFHLLDENKAALNRFAESRKMLSAFSANEHRELRYRNYYNTGIIYFIEGDYQAAVESFKDALREDPRRLEAKRNLELSLMAISGERAETDNTGAKRENTAMEIFFDFIRQKEQQQWKSREWKVEENQTGPDY
ncbi:MAG: VWA domain-containing protein [Treponema sp.]|jgi:Ca-activated chloride channel family protein|nr:VWA domain-containing protein [Treponema sp.]